MSHTTSIRRTASVLGATGLVALSLAGPASARPDPGSGSPGEQHCTTSCYQGGSVGGSTDLGPAIAVDDNGIHVLQIGAGLLAGVALAGAGMAVASRRSHAHAAHPA
jgi:hypothetical protein